MADTRINSPASVRQRLLNLAREQGLAFETDRLTAEAIREEQQYGGIRLKTLACLGKTRIPIVIDVGFGDTITEPDYTIEYPTLLDMPAGNIRAYPPASVVAEKLHAIVTLGLINSRMKDYHDLWAILRSQAFQEGGLQEAIRATFERRETAVPAETPAGLTPEFSADPLKAQQWRTYAASVALEGLSLIDVIASIWAILGPACKRLTR